MDNLAYNHKKIDLNTNLSLTNIWAIFEDDLSNTYDPKKVFPYKN